MSQIVENLKKEAREKNSELFLEASYYIENIESELRKEILTFEEFIEKNKENPKTKWVKIRK